MKIKEIKTNMLFTSDYEYKLTLISVEFLNNYVFFGYSDGSVYIWNTRRWRLEKHIQCHSKSIISILTKYPDTLLTASTDSLCIWKLLIPSSAPLSPSSSSSSTTTTTSSLSSSSSNVLLTSSTSSINSQQSIVNTIPPIDVKLVIKVNNNNY